MHLYVHPTSSPTPLFPPFKFPPMRHPPPRVDWESSKQPNVSKNQPHRDEKPEPNLPPHARLLRHPQHAVHRPPQPHARVVERVVHGVREGGRGADLVADGDGDLLRKGQSVEAGGREMSFLEREKEWILEERGKKPVEERHCVGGGGKEDKNEHLSASSPWR